MPSPALSTAWVPLWPLTPPSRQVETMILIEEQIRATDGSFQFNAIPQTFKHLKLMVNAQSSHTGAKSDGLFVRMNGYAGGTDYQSKGDAATLLGSFAQVGLVTSSEANVLGQGPSGGVEIDIPFYTVPHRMGFHGRYVAKVDTSGSPGTDIATGTQDAVLIAGAANVTSLAVAGVNANLKAGSRCTLYGIGDTLITPPGTYTLPTYGTTLPASPADGQEAVLVDSLTNPSYQWRFRYNAGSVSAFKWEFVGGRPFYHNVDTNQTTSSGGFADLTTPGPLFTIPRAGEYLIRYSALVGQTQQGASAYIGMMKNGGEQDRIAWICPGNGSSMMQMSQKYETFAAADVVKLMYAASANVANFDRRRMTVEPFRVA